VTESGIVVVCNQEEIYTRQEPYTNRQVG